MQITLKKPYHRKLIIYRSKRVNPQHITSFLEKHGVKDWMIKRVLEVITPKKLLRIKLSNSKEGGSSLIYDAH